MFVYYISIQSAIYINESLIYYGVDKRLNVSTAAWVAFHTWQNPFAHIQDVKQPHQDKGLVYKSDK